MGFYYRLYSLDIFFFLLAASRVTVKSGLCAESLEGDSRRHPRMGLTSCGHSLGSEQHLTVNYNGPYRKKDTLDQEPFFFFL